MRVTAPHCSYCRLLDSDSYLYRDPYKYVKVPPYKDVIWIALADSDNPRPTFTNGEAAAVGQLAQRVSRRFNVAVHHRRNCGAQVACRIPGHAVSHTHQSTAHPPLCMRVGGASYIQNAAPGGGAAWTIAYMAERMIRVNEDWELWAANANYSGMGHLQDAMMDQARQPALPSGTLQPLSLPCVLSHR